jgi:hypothetical protein
MGEAHRPAASETLVSHGERAAGPGVGAASRDVGPPGRPEERGLTITLTRTQIDQIVRGALADPALPGVTPGLVRRNLGDAHVRQTLSERYRGLQRNRRLSRSLLAGLLVLSCFSPEGTELGIKDISDQLELNSSTVHRYVATLLAAGLLERDPDTRRYRLLPE